MEQVFGQLEYFDIEFVYVGFVGFWGGLVLENVYNVLVLEDFFEVGVFGLKVRFFKFFFVLFIVDIFLKDDKENFVGKEYMFIFEINYFFFDCFLLYLICVC